MKTTRNNAASLRTALEEWQRRGLLDESVARKLHQDIEVIPFDWKRLAKYSFWVSLICIVTAVGAILADSVLIALLDAFFNAPPVVKLLGSSFLSGLVFWWGMRRRALYPKNVFSNEAIFFIGVLGTGAAIHQLGVMLDTGTGHFSLLLLLSFFVYAALAYFLRSNLIWLFALVSFGSWMGTETGYVSGWGAYYLGMNYPLRFVLLGGALTAVAFAGKKSWLRFFFRSTLAMGLLYLFISLWLMSIFGNYGDMSSWYAVKQYELFHWSLLFGLASGAAIYHGLKFDNGMTKGFGITFLLINLYTRFFEYFWQASHKAIFFGLLGLSFWYLGSRAEKVWQLGENKKDGAEGPL